eukprot:gene11626-8014_t
MCMSKEGDDNNNNKKKINDDMEDIAFILPELCPTQVPPQTQINGAFVRGLEEVL